MNIDEIDIYEQFLNGFNNDLKRIENTECFYTDFPYVLRDCLERRASLIMVNCCNDIFNPLGMEFNTK